MTNLVFLVLLSDSVSERCRFELVIPAGEGSAAPAAISVLGEPTAGEECELLELPAFPEGTILYFFSRIVSSGDSPTGSNAYSPGEMKVFKSGFTSFLAMSLSA